MYSARPLGYESLEPTSFLPYPCYPFTKVPADQRLAQFISTIRIYRISGTDIVVDPVTLWPLSPAPIQEYEVPYDKLEFHENLNVNDQIYINILGLSYELVWYTRLHRNGGFYWQLAFNRPLLYHNEVLFMDAHMDAIDDIPAYRPTDVILTEPLPPYIEHRPLGVYDDLRSLPTLVQSATRGFMAMGNSSRFLGR